MRRSLPPIVGYALLLAASSVGDLTAQQTRYRDPVFDNVDVQTDIAFGAAVNRYTQQTETLRLDLYQPRGDAAAQRAAVVIVHGGGFVSGDKGSSRFRQLGNDFARRGYIAISINYRLRPAGFPVRQDITDAAHDFKAAVRWLRKNAVQLRLDGDRVGCIGSSAGAITCCEAAYVPSEGASGNPGFSSQVHTVIDLWGFLADLTEMDAGEAPVQIIHGTLDSVVPYQLGVDLKQRADAVGVPAELLPIVGAGHAPWSIYFASFHEQAVGFLFDHLRLAQRSGLAARPGFSSPGSLTIDTFGTAGDQWVLMLGAGRIDVPLPPLGVFCLDPVGLIALPAKTLPGAPRIATGASSFAVPAGLAGQTAYWQAVHAQPGVQLRLLTNCESTAF